MNKKLITITLATIITLIAMTYTNSTTGKDYVIEIDSSDYIHNIEPYKSDTVQVAQGYQKLIERYQDMTMMNFNKNHTEMKYMILTLESIDKKLDNISTRLSRVENKLGIKPLKKEESEPNKQTQKQESKKTVIK